LGLLTDTLTIVSKDEMLRRIHQDYLELPDVRLSLTQAQRVWQLDERTCAELLESLIESGLLHRSHDGTYGLSPRGVLESDRFAEADLYETVGAGS
jgi:uncharacterized protein with von Willebrand factor type A (vWA) domain